MKNRDGESWEKLPSPTSVSENDDWGVAAKEDNLLWGSINGTEVADEKTLEEELLGESGVIAITEGRKK